MKNKVISVNIVPNGVRHVQVTWSYMTMFKVDEVSGWHSCYIPGFEISFSAPTREKADAKGAIIMEMFFDHFLSNENTGLKTLALELNKLGFKAPNHMLALKGIINNQVKDTKFKSQIIDIPVEFEGSQEFERSAKKEAVY